MPFCVTRRDSRDPWFRTNALRASVRCRPRLRGYQVYKTLFSFYRLIAKQVKKKNVIYKNWGTKMCKLVNYI